MLVTRTRRSVAVQVLGNAKGVVAAVISVFIFKNDITVTGALGYLITVMGTALYTYVKVMEKVKEQGDGAGDGEQAQSKEASETGREYIPRAGEQRADAAGC
jgi:hypothetical protein